MTSEDLSEDSSSDHSESYHAYLGPHPQYVRAILQEGEREFWIHLVVPPPQMLRQPSYRWYNSIFNQIDLQRYRAKMRIYPEAIWTNGHRWLTFFLVISLSLNPLEWPNVPLSDLPTIITSARFHRKKRALLVCKCLRRSWRCTSLDMAETYIGSC